METVSTDKYSKEVFYKGEERNGVIPAIEGFMWRNITRQWSWCICKIVRYFDLLNLGALSDLENT